MMKKREEHHADRVKYKVLSAAKKLFVRQGYKKTTIRQIVEESGVLTGSIYYLYKNKADIFQALVLSLLRGCVELIDQRYKDESPAFKLAAMFMVELKCVEEDELVRESYYEGYTSNAIFEKMVEHMTGVTEKLFAEQSLSCSHEELYVRILLIKGAMRSCIARFYFTKPVDIKEVNTLLLRMSLGLFQVPKDECESILQRILSMEEVWLEIARTLRDRQEKL